MFKFIDQFDVSPAEQYAEEERRKRAEIRQRSMKMEEERSLGMVPQSSLPQYMVPGVPHIIR